MTEKADDIAERLYARLLAEADGDKAAMFSALTFLVMRVIVHHVEPLRWPVVVQLMVDQLGGLCPSYASKLRRETKQ